MLGSGIFTQDGEEWRHSRALLRPQFSSNQQANFEQIKRCVDDVIAEIPADDRRSPVDLQPLFFKLTFDTTMFLLFGDAVSKLDWGQVAGQQSAFAQAFTLAQDYLAHRGRLGPFYWLLNDRAFRNACKTCHRVVDQAIEKALEVNDVTDGHEEGRSGKNYVFLSALAEQTQDRKVLRDQCFNVLLAGRDTTGCCLTWTFRLLARHPNVLEKLRNEIAATCGLGANSQSPTKDDLRPAKMPYLSIVIKEGLSCPTHSLTTASDPRFLKKEFTNRLFHQIKSATPVSFCARQLKRSRPDDDTPHGRRAGRDRTAPRPARRGRRVLCLRYAPTKRPVRRGRG